MTTHHVERLSHLTAQLTKTLMTAALCADEIQSTIRAELESDTKNGVPAFHSNGAAANRPLLDQSTFSVGWRGRRLLLGHTRLFWVLERLARSPNQYITHHDLLNDVWDDDELNTATIRSVVRHLRVRVRQGGMEGLADAICGHNGHYVLKL
jgi:DNA-binding response OmpR family regulator